MKKQFHASAIPLFVCIGFLAGIVLLHVIGEPIIIPIAVICGFLCFTVSIIIKNYFRIVFSVIAGLLFGFCRSSITINNHNQLSVFLDKEIELSGILQSDAIVDNQQIKIQLGGIIINQKTIINDCQIYATIASQEKYSRSDRVVLRGKLLEGFGDYSGYM